MTVRVLLFARARDLAGCGQIAVDIADGATVGDLRAELGRRLPTFAALLPTLHIAVNTDYAAEGDVIPPGAEVACFPAVSGG